MFVRRFATLFFSLTLLAAAATPAWALRVMPWSLGEQSGASDIFVDLHGFFSESFSKIKSSANPDGNSTFDIPAVYLLPSAQLSDKLSTHVEIEFEHATTIKVDRAWLQYTPLSDKGALAIVAGRVYVPFIHEVEFYQAPLRLLVNRPLSTEEVGFDEFQDIGLRIIGTVPTSRIVSVHYDLGVYNGTKISRQFSPGLSQNDDLRDVNNQKMTAGRLGLNLWKNRVKVGTSGFYDGNWAPSSVTGEAFTTAGGAGYLDVLWSDVLVRGEWYRRVSNVFGSRKEAATGWYTQLAYGWRPGDLLPVSMIRPALQFDWLNNPGGVRRRLAGGVTVFPMGYLQVKTEYEINRGDQKGQDYSGFLASLVAEF